MKKFISIFLAVLMIVTILPLSAFAENTHRISDSIRNTTLKGNVTDYSTEDLLDSVEYELKGSFDISFASFSDSVNQKFGAHSACYTDIDDNGQDELIIISIEEDPTSTASDNFYYLALSCFHTKNDNYIYCTQVITERIVITPKASYSADVFIENGYVYISSSYASGIEGAGSSWQDFTTIYSFKNNQWNCEEDYYYGVSYGRETFGDNIKGTSTNSQISKNLEQKENKIKNTYMISKADSTNYFDSVALLKSAGFSFTVTAVVDEHQPSENTGDVIASGTCGANGDNQKWTLYTSGELVISGSGETTASGDVTDSIPWYDYRDQITTVIIEADVTDISPSAFYGENMTTFYVESDNAYYSSDEHGILFNKNKTSLLSVPAATPITEYTVPSSVTSVAGKAFIWNINLTDVVLPDGITEISYETFFCSNIQTVSIPASVTEIDWWAFEVCEQLHTVYYAGTEAQWNNIYIEQGNDYLTNADIIYNATDDQPGNDEHTEHNYVQTDKQEATCTQNGSITYTCSECGDSYTKTISEGHKFTKYEVIQEATPYQDGIWEKTCKRCNEKSQQKFKYNYPEYSDYPFVITTPEYVNVGDEFEVTISFEDLRGKDQGFFFMYYDSDILEFLEWEYLFGVSDIMTGGGTVVTDMNHISTFFVFYDENTVDTSELVKFTFRAINSGTVEFHAEQYYDFDSYWNRGKDIPLPGDATVTVLDDHDHSYTYSVTFPTCTEPGYITYSCSCGYSYAEEYLNATGHTPGEWVVEKEATDNSNGLRQQECSVCGEIVDKQIIPALNQSYDGVTQFHLEMPSEVKVGDTFDIILSCSAIYGVSSGNISFRYKTQYLELVSAVTLLDADANANGIEEDLGRISEAFMYSNKCMEQNAQIAKYTFRALQDGECYVEVYTESWENATAPLDLGATITINPDKILCETGHTPGEWIVTKEATDNSNGLRQQECTVCGEILDTQIIPALNQSYDDGVTRFHLEIPSGVAVGDTFDITFSCSDLYGFEAGVVKFRYKTDMLELVSTETLFDTDVNRQFIDEDNGIITESFVFVEHCKEQDSPIAKYTFRALQPGECYVEVYTNDWEGSDIPLDLGAIFTIDEIKQNQEVYATGDVNGDGKLSASDARAALRMSAKLDTPTQTQFAAADVNKDGKLTASDARIILRVSAKLQTF